jgi:FMN phosphatase YigB (HAD superfamily)
MKKIISFDLDGTIVSGHYGDMVWNHGIPEVYAKRYSMSFDDAQRYIRREYESVGDEEIIWYEIEHWLERFDLPVQADELLEKYESYIEIVPHAREVLEELAKGHTLVVASNAARIFVDKELRCSGLAGYFTHIISATTDYGMVKKEEHFYRRLCELFGVLPGEVAHVGDHPVFDHDVPAGMGIEAYYLQHEHSAVSHQLSVKDGRNVIKDLRELLDRL